MSKDKSKNLQSFISSPPTLTFLIGKPLFFGKQTKSFPAISTSNHKRNLFNMFPNLSSINKGSQDGANAIFSCKSGVLSVPHALCLFSNLFYGFLCEFSTMLRLPDSSLRNKHSALSASMFEVFRTCDPFKVSPVIISSIAVFMVYLRFVFKIWDKRPRNKSMDLYLDIFAIFAGANYLVSIGDIRLKDALRNRKISPIFSPCNSWQALYSAIVADLVHPFVTRYIAPFFHVVLQRKSPFMSPARVTQRGGFDCIRELLACPSKSVNRDYTT
jgi:hypothetical protein